MCRGEGRRSFTHNGEVVEIGEYRCLIDRKSLARSTEIGPEIVGVVKIGMRTLREYNTSVYGSRAKPRNNGEIEKNSNIFQRNKRCYSRHEMENGPP